MKKLFDRLLYLINFFENNSQSQFARKIGCPQTTLNGYLNETGEKKIKVSLLEKILLAYPTVSKTWLYFGEEPIFNEKSEVVPPTTEEFEELKRENEKLKQELAEADRLNRKLTAKIFVDGGESEKTTTGKAAGQE